MRAVAVMYFMRGGPPSSPPIALALRANKIRIAIAASEQNSVTENAKLMKRVKKINQKFHQRNVTYFPLCTWK